MNRFTWTADEAGTLDVDTLPATPDGGVIVAELFTAADGTPVATAEQAATIEVHVRYPDGTVERTYLNRGATDWPLQAPGSVPGPAAGPQDPTPPAGS